MLRQDGRRCVVLQIRNSVSVVLEDRNKCCIFSRPPFNPANGGESLY